MKHAHPLSIVLLLIGATFSLQAIPMDREIREKDVSKNAAQIERAGREQSETTTAGNDLQRQDGPLTTVDPTISTSSSSSSSSLGAAAEAQQAQLGQGLIEMHQQTAEEAALHLINRSYSADAADVFAKMEEEIQQDQPRENVIDLHTQAAGLYQQAADAKKQLSIKTSYLGYAGDALCEAAREAQGAGRQNLIDLYTQAAGLHQQAAAAGYGTDGSQAFYLKKAGDALSNAARETQQNKPRPDLITLYTRAADLHSRASTAADSPMGKSLDNVGNALSKAARDLQEGKQIEIEAENLYQHAVALHQRVVELHQRAEELCQQAAGAGDAQEALNLRKAGDAFSYAAEEAQQNEPRGQVINYYTQSAELVKKAVKARKEGKKEMAYYFNNAATALYQVGKESQRDQPEKEVIDLYIEAATLHQQAAEEAKKRYFQAAKNLGNQANQKFKQAKDKR